MRLGVLGGTFDPIHLGHLVIAQEALLRENLDQVLFVPSKDPWLKSSVAISSASDRAEMVRRAINGNGSFRFSTVDLERSGLSYTVDTLADLRRELSKAELYFILGMDSLIDFPRWREPRKILELAHLIVFYRPSYEGTDLERVYKAVSGLRERMTVLEHPLIGISATEVRNRVAKGLSIRYWVPEQVEAYIKEKGLYKLQRR